MPNHVKNRIEIIGTPEQIKEVFGRFNTSHDEHPRIAHDGTVIYLSNDGQIGWLNESTNIFTRRGEGNIIGVPEGFSIDMTPSFDEFPDFNKIIPQPVNIFNGDLGEKERQMCAREGRPNWMDWNLENWGSKWGGYSFEKESDSSFTFETAWSSATKVIRAMSGACPDVTINYEYSDKDTGSNCGQLVFKNGEILSEFYPGNQSSEAYDLAFKLRLEYREDYIFSDGKYIMKDA